MRVEVSAKFANMPTRTAAHTSAVNSMPGMWDMFHLIRFICQVKGLFIRCSGHMGHIRVLGRGPRAPTRNGDEHEGVSPRTEVVRGPPSLRARTRVKVYGDLNT